MAHDVRRRILIWKSKQNESSAQHTKQEMGLEFGLDDPSIAFPYVCVCVVAAGKRGKLFGLTKREKEKTGVRFNEHVYTQRRNKTSK